MFKVFRAGKALIADWLTFWVSSGVAFVGYLLSLGPSIGLEDAGELVTAADGLGVPHPPGYPLWTMVSWLFCRVFGWVYWRGWPNAAWAVSLGSAVMGALAVGVLGMLVSRMVRGGQVGGEALAERTRAWVGILAGIGAGLGFAFSPGMWSQAVIPEVYALGALFLSLVLLLAYDWYVWRRGRTLVLLGLVFGLGLTNYQVLLLAGVPLGVMVAVRRWRLAQSFLAVGLVLGLVGYFLWVGSLPTADVYSSGVDPVVLRPAWVEGSRLAGVYGMSAGEVERLLVVRGVCEAGAEVGRVPVWAYGLLGGLFACLVGVVTCWRGFWRVAWGRWLVAGLAVAFLGGVSGFCWVSGVWRVPAGFQGLLYPFGWSQGALAVGLAGVWGLCWRWRRGRCFAGLASVGLLGLWGLLRAGLLLGLEHPLTGWFWWPAGALVGVLLMAWRLLPGGRWVALTVVALVAGVSVYGYLPLASDGRALGMNWGYARVWEGFVRVVLREQYEAISPASPFSPAYWGQLVRYLRDLWMQFSAGGVLLGLVGVFGCGVAGVWRRRWRGVGWLACLGGVFVMMSVVLVALANPTGELQDGFIQKVKFISSHQLFAVWVGCGLAVVGGWLVRWRRVGWGLLMGLALVVALAPVGENLWNGRLVREFGAAEQTGHDFGWQFGAYMMGGAPVIAAELSPDEEPLPDPFWPAPMEAGAVYFGGTDPGRFVPTYMVYSVGFRPDVRVLTQNALADPTYMNGVRDLYGAALWLPSADDVREAFLSFTDAVLSGRREAGGQVQEVNGRVQVSGAAAVMKISEALAQMVFERNPDRAFYVEESYRMAWMDALLEPAGLAMRLQRTGADWEAVAARDGDFWDWMVRRLVVRRDYRRDFAAQKSFSTLRAAQGGAYARGRQEVAAERAFQEALVLYPISPAVLFRYVQESLLPRGRYAEAERLVAAYVQVDEQNEQARQMLVALGRFRAHGERFDELTQRVRNRVATTADVCELARVAELLGRDRVAQAYWEQVVAAPDLRVEDARRGCMVLQRLGRLAEAMALLRRVPEGQYEGFSEVELVAASGLAQVYGARQMAARLLAVAEQKAPTSGRVWLGYALFYYQGGDGAQAYACMERAVKFGAAPLIEADEAGMEVYWRLQSQFGPRKGRTE